MLWNPLAETMSRDERGAGQQAALRALVDRLLAGGGPVGRRLRSAGVQHASEVFLDELHRLPATEKRDLWDNYPYGLLEVPREELAAVHGSSGTGGRPTLVGYTDGDLDLWAEMCARSLGCIGATPASTVHNAYGYGLFTGGLGIHQGARRMGATVIPVSGGMTDRQVTLLRDLRPDVLACTPSYAVTVGEALRAAGVAREDVSLRMAVLGAEPWSEGLRRQIEELLPVKAMDIYGLSEVIGPGVATECVEAQSGLHVNEDHFLVEAIDPADGAPVPLGSPGELVFTTPTKQALPLLRYRTGDIATLDSGDCACGRTLVRMSKVLGRRDDMLVVRGVNVYPAEIEAVLLGDHRVAPHYVLVHDRRRPTGRLLVGAELAGAYAAAAGDPAKAAIIAQAELDHRLRERLGLHAEVTILPAGAVPRHEVGKAVRVLVWSTGPTPVPGLD